MKRPPQPRPAIYDLYWTFASQRQQIWERRQSGQPAPWTADPILREYKFCNVFRAADRVSQYLIREVACNRRFDHTDDQLFQITAFRLFNKIETWEGLKTALGRPPQLSDLSSGTLQKAIEETKATNGTIYTSAYILCANNAFGFDKKHLNHLALLKRMFVEDALAKKLREAPTLESVYHLLHGYPLMGDFMSYQLAIDLNYSSQINFSEDDFCQVGPGALRGIKKAFVSLGDYTPNEIVHRMVAKQKAEFERLQLPFAGLRGRPLHAIDCQGLFCELDKYCRVAAPELKSQRTRIKARFTPLPQAPAPFFPPKWGINE